MCGPLPIVSGAAYTLWVATQGIYRRYIVIVFVINTGKYRNVYRDKYGRAKCQVVGARTSVSVRLRLSVRFVRPSVRPFAIRNVLLRRLECVSSPLRAASVSRHQVATVHCECVSSPHCLCTASVSRRPLTASIDSS